MKSFLLLSFVWPAWAWSIEINPENIKDLVYSKSSRILASKMDVEAAHQREGFFVRSLLPAIEVFGAQETFKIGANNTENQPVYGAEAKLNLFNGGRDLLLSEVRMLNSQKREFQLLRIQSEELQKARVLYWNILYSIQRAELISSALKINSENLKSADRRIANGVGTESDRVDFEMKEVDLGYELAETKLRLQSDTSALALILNIEDPKSLVFPQKMEHEHDFADTLKHTVTDHDFLYKEHELQASADTLESRRAGRAWWPQLDAYATYTQYNQREKDFPAASDRVETVAGLKVTLSLGAIAESGSESSALSKESIRSRTLADMEKREIENHVQNEISELYLLHDQVHAAEQNIIRAEKYFKLTQSEYSRGVKNSPDVLGASEKLFSTKNKHYEIVRDFQIAKAHVLSKIGR